MRTSNHFYKNLQNPGNKHPRMSFTLVKFHQHEKYIKVWKGFQNRDGFIHLNRSLSPSDASLNAPPWTWTNPLHLEIDSCQLVWQIVWWLWWRWFFFKCIVFMKILVVIYDVCSFDIEIYHVFCDNVNWQSITSFKKMSKLTWHGLFSRMIRIIKKCKKCKFQGAVWAHMTLSSLAHDPY